MVAIWVTYNLWSELLLSFYENVILYCKTFLPADLSRMQLQYNALNVSNEIIALRSRNILIYFPTLMDIIAFNNIMLMEANVKNVESELKIWLQTREKQSFKVDKTSENEMKFVKLLEQMVCFEHFSSCNVHIIRRKIYAAINWQTSN